MTSEQFGQNCQQTVATFVETQCSKIQDITIRFEFCGKHLTVSGATRCGLERRFNDSDLDVFALANHLCDEFAWCIYRCTPAELKRLSPIVL